MQIDVINELTEDILRLEVAIKEREERLDDALLSEPDYVSEEELLSKYGDEAERIKRQKFVLLKKKEVYNQAIIDYQAAYYKEMALRVKPIYQEPKHDDYTKIADFSRGERKRAAYFDKEQFRAKWNVYNQEIFH